jgi:hypothetical protein
VFAVQHVHRAAGDAAGMVGMEGTDQNASFADRALNGSVCQNQLIAQREPCDNKPVEVIEERLPFGLEALGLSQPGQFLG